MESLRTTEAPTQARMPETAPRDASTKPNAAGRPAPRSFAEVLAQARAGARVTGDKEGDGHEPSGAAPPARDAGALRPERDGWPEDQPRDGAAGKRRSLGALEGNDEREWADHVNPGAWAILSAPPVGAPAPKAEVRVHPSDVAALAERFVTRFRVGRSSKGEVVDLSLGQPGDAQIEVRLIRAGNGVEAVLRAAPGHDGDSARLAERVAAELERAGVSVESIRGEPKEG